MTLYIGVDIHTRQQTVSYLDTEDGATTKSQLKPIPAFIADVIKRRTGVDNVIIRLAASRRGRKHFGSKSHWRKQETR